MAIFSITINDALVLGVESARQAYNNSIPATVPDPDPEAAEGATIPNPALINSTEGYLSFVATRAAESWCRQHGHPVPDEPPTIQPGNYRGLYDAILESNFFKSAVLPQSATTVAVAGAWGIYLATMLHAVMGYPNDARIKTALKRLVQSTTTTAGQRNEVIALVNQYQLPQLDPTL